MGLGIGLAGHKVVPENWANAGHAARDGLNTGMGMGLNTEQGMELGMVRVLRMGLWMG